MVIYGLFLENYLFSGKYPGQKYFLAFAGKFTSSVSDDKKTMSSRSRKKEGTSTGPQTSVSTASTQVSVSKSKSSSSLLRIERHQSITASSIPVRIEDGTSCILIVCSTLYNLTLQIRSR